MSDSGGSSPFLESPLASPAEMKDDKNKDRQIISLQYKLSTLQNDFEIERLRMQQQNNAIEKKYRVSVDNLEKALNDTKYLFETNSKQEEDLKDLRTKLEKLNSIKESEVRDLNTKVYTLERLSADAKTHYDSQLSNAQKTIESYEIDMQGSKSLLERYENEISRQSNELKELQKKTVTRMMKLPRYEHLVL